MITKESKWIKNPQNGSKSKIHTVRNLKLGPKIRFSKKLPKNFEFEFSRQNSKIIVFWLKNSN